MNKPTGRLKFAYETIYALEDEIKALQDQLKHAYCGIIGSDSIVGLDSCDNYKEWLLTLTK